MNKNYTLDDFVVGELVLLKDDFIKSNLYYLKNIKNLNLHKKIFKVRDISSQYLDIEPIVVEEGKIDWFNSDKYKPAYFNPSEVYKINDI